MKKQKSFNRNNLVDQELEILLKLRYHVSRTFHFSILGLEVLIMFVCAKFFDKIATVLSSWKN